MASRAQLKILNDLVKIEGMVVDNYQLVRDFGYVIFLKSQSLEMKCPNCGCLTDKLHQNHWLTIKDLPLCEHAVYLKINRRQMNCLNCGKKFSEEFSFLEKRSGFTQRIKQKIVEEILSSDIKNVATRNGLSEQEVETIVAEAGVKTIGKIPENLSRLGIDEIAFVKGQKNYCAVLVDLDKKQLITILPSRTQAEVEKCLKSWGTVVLSQIKEVSIDLYTPYQSLVNQLMPQAEVVGDRFHVMGQVNDELDRERRKIKRESEQLKEPNKKTEALTALTHSKYALLKNNEDLNELQQEKLTEISRVHPQLMQLYELKESFRNIFESKITENEALIKICEWLVAADSKFPKSCGTIKRWIGEIISYFANRTTQGVVEGINNKLKLIKRRGYGFRNFTNFQIRCLLNWHFS